MIPAEPDDDDEVSLTWADVRTFVAILGFAVTIGAVVIALLIWAGGP